MASIDEDVFICSICMDIFENPKMLPCQHSFCNNCLLSFIEKKRKCAIGRLKSFDCPLCRHSVPLGNRNDSEDMFPTTYLLSTLLEARRRNIHRFCQITKHMSTKQTQTGNKKDRKVTRTIGTQIKLCKTTQIAVQTECYGKSVQNKRTQTTDARLSGSVNKGTQTDEAVQNGEDKVFAERNVIDKSTTEGNTSNCVCQLRTQLFYLAETIFLRARNTEKIHVLHFGIVLCLLLLTVSMYRQNYFDMSDLYSKAETFIEQLKQTNISQSTTSTENGNKDSFSSIGSLFKFIGSIIGGFLSLASMFGVAFRWSGAENVHLPPGVTGRRWRRLQMRRQRRLNRRR